MTQTTNTMNNNARRWWRAAAIVSVATLIFSCTDKTTQSSPQTAVAKVDYFADNALGNPLAMVQHPAGIHEKGITYVSYQGPGVNPYVASYNHKSQTWQGPYQAGHSDLGALITERNKIDSHGKPTMLIDDLGYIHIFYGGHGAGTKYGKNHYGRGGIGRNKHAISKRPYDISEWQDLDNISIFGTYNQAIKMDNGDIYLIYRHGAHRSDWVYQKSTDHGRTFEPVVSLLKTKIRDDEKAADSWYVWATKGQGDEIILGYDYHVCWLPYKGPLGRGHVTERHDVYYMTLNTQTGEVRNIHGETLATPVTKELADSKTLVARTGEGNWTFNGSAHLDQHKHPHIAVNIGKDMGKNTGGPKQTAHFRWDGSQWLAGAYINQDAKHANTDTRGDFYFDPASDKLKYLLGYQDATDGIVAVFESNDNGESFTKRQELLRKANATWALTAKISNAHPDAQLLVAEKRKGEKWHKVYLLGENGPLLRPASEAQLLTAADKSLVQ